MGSGSVRSLLLKCTNYLARSIDGHVDVLADGQWQAYSLLNLKAVVTASHWCGRLAYDGIRRG